MKILNIKYKKKQKLLSALLIFTYKHIFVPFCSPHLNALSKKETQQGFKTKTNTNTKQHKKYVNNA